MCMSVYVCPYVVCVCTCVCVCVSVYVCPYVVCVYVHLCIHVYGDSPHNTLVILNVSFCIKTLWMPAVRTSGGEAIIASL